MTEEPLRVLFLSRRNTVRSLMAEAVMNQSGAGRFVARSAGVEVAKTDPLTFEVLQKARLATGGLHPKTLQELLEVDAAPFDFIFTLSDTARDEPFPEWPGQPISAHWSCEDPVLVDDAELGRPLIYGRVLAGIERRIAIFMQLPFATLDRASLQRHVDQITDNPL